jgi:hypothetical protein
MPILGALCWIVGTENVILAVRLGFVLMVALLAALGGALLIREPLWMFGILAGAMVVSFRIAVPIVLHFIPVPPLDWQATTTERREVQGLTAYSCERLWHLANAAYRDLKADPEAWEREQQERTAWDTTLLHGLEGA